MDGVKCGSVWKKVAGLFDQKGRGEGSTAQGAAPLPGLPRS